MKKVFLIGIVSAAFPVFDDVCMVKRHQGEKWWGVWKFRRETPRRVEI